ncbi:MAG: hypothetical protein KC656_34680, partial [Myxococcales bacterium]|nr:hypothetical protein [Myxococcales bacterium]
MSPAAGRAWVALAVLCLLAFSAWGAHLVVGVRGERAEVAARVQALAALDALENGHPAPLPDLVTARPDGTALKAALDAHDVREAREHVRALEAALRAENGVLSARLGERLRNLGFLVALSVGLGF